MAIRLIKQLLLLLFAVLLLSQNAHAEQDTSLSPSVVLVLKLVSTTHVRPTTGIVISETGLVLVPTDFVGADTGEADGEILVLDGGTDIISHGRPAVVINRSITGGLAVLSVAGLKRPGITLSEDAFHQKNDLHFEAFPPAENIAKGAEPLWIAASSKTRLPYVSGPIIDTCGHLAGLSLTRGSQSMETGTAPAIISAAEIKRVLESMQLSMPGASCGATLKQAAIAEVVKDGSIRPEGIVEPSEPSDTMDETGALTVAVRSSVNPFSPANTHQVVKTTARPSLWRSVPWWLKALGFIMLAVTAWKGFFLYRLRKIGKGHVSAISDQKIQPASDEPDTALLGAIAETPFNKPRSAPVDETEIPDVNTLPAEYDAIVVLEGISGDDFFFRRFSPVNTQQADIIVGRGEVDISIAHPAISRLHALMKFDKGTMTLSDTGSHNGTYINGIPCLSGEIMFIEPEDDIYLGGIQVRFSLVKKKADHV